MTTPTAATEQALKKLEDQLTCAVCLDRYQDPKLLSCFHVFCRKCLQPLARQGAQGQIVQCPNCRQSTALPQSGVPGLQGAFYVHHLLDIHSALKRVTESQESLCNKCKLEEVVNFCRNCGQFICSTCTKMHKTWEELSSHEVITLQQLTSDAANLVPSRKQVMPCSKHPAIALDLYCETCEELICRNCIVKVHRDHQYDLVGDAIPKHKDVIIASLEPVEKQLLSVNKALEDLDARRSQVTEQCQVIKTQIQESIQQLHQTLETRKQDLIGQLEQIAQQKLKSLAAQQDQIELVGTQLRNCRDFVQESLRTGSEAEILAMKKSVVKQIGEMTTSFKPQVLVVQEKANMVFSHNQSELILTCREFGKVHAHPVCPEKCCISSPEAEFLWVGETATATLLAMDQDGQEYQRALEDVKSELVSSDGSVRVAAEVKERGGNKYEISYRPQSRGQHHLHIRVEGRHISGSPFPVVVQPKELTAIRTIEGLETPWGVTVNDRGEIIVAEYGRHCISMFSANGEKINSFGVQGSGPGQLKWPIGVVVDGEGNTLVCDQCNHRILKFSSSGTLMKSVGKYGSGPLQFNFPYGIAIHPYTNKVYVADTLNHRIQVLNEDMTFSSSFGSKGSNSEQLMQPHDMTFDSDGNVYIMEYGNHQIQVFTKENQYLRQFGKEGKEEGELSNPRGVAMDTGDTLYIAECGNKRISLFTKEGQFLRAFKPLDSEPFGITFGKNGLIYVTYGDTGCIKVF